MKLLDFIEKYGNCEIKDIDKMKKIIISTERFKPINGESYYYISVGNNIGESKWYNDELDNSYYSLNRIYRTRQECERYIEIHKKFREVSCVPNWGYDNDVITIAYNTELGRLYFHHTYIVEFPNLYYFSSLKEIDKLIKEFGEADIKKYILGIYDLEDN